MIDFYVYKIKRVQTVSFSCPFWSFLILKRPISCPADAKTVPHSRRLAIALQG